MQANTAWSQTLNRLTLHRVKQIFQIFEYLYFQGIKDPYDDILKKIRIFFENPKLANPAQSLTPPRLTLGGVNSAQANTARS